MLNVFLALQTQWRMLVPPMGGAIIWLGLDYQAAEATIRLMGYQDQSKTLFEGLRIMEAAALPIRNRPT